MTVEQVLVELEKRGTAQTRKTYLNHGCPEALFGVTSKDLHLLIKQHKLKNDHELAIALFDTGNYDAQYLAGLIADAERMTLAQIHKWEKSVTAYPVGDFIVAPVVSETPFAVEKAKEYFASGQTYLVSCAYFLLALYAGFVRDDALDKTFLRQVLKKVPGDFQASEAHVRLGASGLNAKVRVAKKYAYNGIMN